MPSPTSPQIPKNPMMRRSFGVSSSFRGEERRGSRFHLNVLVRAAGNRPASGMPMTEGPGETRSGKFSSFELAIVHRRPVAALRPCAANDGNAAVPVLRGSNPNSRSRPHSGHRDGREISTSTTGLKVAQT